MEYRDKSHFEEFLIEKGYSLKSIQNYHSHIKKFLTSCEIFTHDSFIHFIVSQRKSGVSSASLNKYVQSVRRYAEFKKQPWFTEITQHYKEGKSNRQPFEDAEIEAFLALPAGSENEESHNKWTVLFSIAAFTGCRIGEVRRLKVEDINFSLMTMVFRDTKGGNDDREVPFETLPLTYLLMLRELIKKHESISKFLFPNAIDPTKPCVEGAYKKSFWYRCNTLGIKNRQSHSLRHSYCTRMADEGMPQAVLQSVVGHKRADTTAIYYHPSLSAKRKAMRKDRMSELAKDAQEALNAFAEDIKNRQFQKDRRFKYKFIESTDGIELSLKIR